MAKLEISKVHDAYARGGECPLCDLREAAEGIYIHSFTHSRVMEPNVRVQTNARGFCPAHLGLLYAADNKLGLGLVMHTHLRETLPRIRAGLEQVRAAARGRKERERADAAARELAGLRDACFICDLLGIDMERYRFTILYLWQKDPDFLPVLQASRGFCLPHYLELFDTAERSLNAKRLAAWLDCTVPLMEKGFDSLESDLLEFTQLYHDANRSMGSDEIRAALGRTIQKLAGARFRPS